MPTKSGATAAKRPAKKTAAASAKTPAQIRAEIEAEVRAQVEAEIRAEMEAEAREQAAAEAALQADAADSTPVFGSDISGDPEAQGAVTINFVDDGFTALGKVWYRGEELTLVPGTKEWDDAPRRRGKIFALLDEYEQEEIWGRRIFRPGKWRGKRLTEIDDPELSDSERAVLARAEARRH